MEKLTLQINTTDTLLRGEYSGQDLSNELFALFLARVWFNADGATKELQAHHQTCTGNRLGEGMPVDEASFLEAARQVPVTPACPLYQLHFSQAEKDRQRTVCHAKTNRVILSFLVLVLVLFLALRSIRFLCVPPTPPPV